MIKIYFNKLAIGFNNEINEISEKINNIEVVCKADLGLFVENLRNVDFENDINLHGYNAGIMFDDFCKLHTYVEAAGGVVRNNQSKYLLIKRFGIWDLPKGKVETEETILDATVREVCEETGLKNVVATKSLPDTYHIYYQHKHWFLKKIHWFLMHTSEDTKLVPQVDEDISEAVWMNKPDALLALSDSYRSLYDNLGYLFKMDDLT